MQLTGNHIEIGIEWNCCEMVNIVRVSNWYQLCQLLDINESHISKHFAEYEHGKLLLLA